MATMAMRVDALVIITESGMSHCAGATGRGLRGVALVHTLRVLRLQAAGVSVPKAAIRAAAVLPSNRERCMHETRAQAPAQ